ncbi:NAD(P)-dependent alcohol dehydrogenase [Escherichia coli]|uniref:NAD(P)-dependent alcohol dehydrogenase n=1 Tax=Escherichia coli TaxID=562 RepID=UPI000BE91C52|nr:NAD(P)-dependent alcohol dehydrogenase [Escherichia coli]EJF6681699.1 NAD(P)-dependent alcohol dehydrogenase [Escherichia coli]MEA0170616.1 NAD(P)-dependent alcohol dehydrogenase [Escherichia coli]HBM7836545.1 NAD(P)-dependent alcohol dehydrogenase [Escherichia coli]
MKIKAVGAYSAKQPLEPMDITRREPGPNDVKIEIAYCGVCHSDLHQVRSEWAGTVYPCVPGHEIVGRVVAVGDQVEKYAPDEPGHTLGGYSQQIVVHERYVLRIRHPQEQLAAVAPLLCAGITTYSPLRHWQAGPGKKVGVVGIGGLGHMGIKLAHAMGAHVVAFTTSEAKREAAKALGADEVVNSRNADEMAAHLKSFDFILNTVAAPHNLDDFTTLLKRDGTMTLVGAPATPHKSPEVFNLIMKRRAIAGSMIGGIPETQEMLDFCAEHGIVADIEMIRADQINEAYERMLRGDVKYRFVIDNRTLTD